MNHTLSHYTVGLEFPEPDVRVWFFDVLLGAFDSRTQQSVEPITSPSERTQSFEIASGDENAGAGHGPGNCSGAPAMVPWNSNRTTAEAIFLQRSDARAPLQRHGRLDARTGLGASPGPSDVEPPAAVAGPHAHRAGVTAPALRVDRARPVGESFVDRFGAHDVEAKRGRC